MQGRESTARILEQPALPEREHAARELQKFEQWFQNTQEAYRKHLEHAARIRRKFAGDSMIVPEHAKLFAPKWKGPSHFAVCEPFLRKWIQEGATLEDALMRWEKESEVFSGTTKGIAALYRREGMLGERRADADIGIGDDDEIEVTLEEIEVALAGLKKRMARKR